MLDDLVVLGFYPEDAEAAVQAVGGGSASASLTACLDWLCLNLPEDRLPSNFAPGAAGKPVGIIRLAGGGGGSSVPDGREAAAAAAAVGEDYEEEAAAAADPAVGELMQYGYPPHAAASALRDCGGHLQNALRQLYAQLAGPEQRHAGPPAGPPAGQAPPAGGAPGSEASAGAGGAGGASEGVAGAPDLAEWWEERVALEGIYGSDAVFHSAGWTELWIPVSLITAEAAARAGGEDEVVLHLNAWAPAAGAYPNHLPTLALRAEAAPPAALLTLTAALAARAAELRGHPMLFELATAAAELLSDCLLHPLPLSRLLPSKAASAASQQQQEEGAPAGSEQRSAGGQQRRRRQEGGGRGGPRIDLAAESRRLLQRQQELDSGREHAAMRTSRGRLPAAAKRAEALELCGRRRVVVVSGATGCGKSTQVPQYILEEAISSGAGAECNIICTQPRRIAAMGLASRVAAERGEPVGGTVGYAVRLDSKQSARTRLLFCTTGGCGEGGGGGQPVVWMCGGCCRAGPCPFAPQGWDGGGTAIFSAQGRGRQGWGCGARLLSGPSGWPAWLAGWLGSSGAGSPAVVLRPLSRQENSPRGVLAAPGCRHPAAAAPGGAHPAGHYPRGAGRGARGELVLSWSESACCHCWVAGRSAGWLKFCRPGHGMPGRCRQASPPRVAAGSVPVPQWGLCARPDMPCPPSPPTHPTAPNPCSAPSSRTCCSCCCGTCWPAVPTRGCGWCSCRPQPMPSSSHPTLRAGWGSRVGCFPSQASHTQSRTCSWRMPWRRRALRWAAAASGRRRGRGGARGRAAGAGLVAAAAAVAAGLVTAAAPAAVPGRKATASRHSSRWRTSMSHRSTPT